jgi:hypothetical protein
MKKKRQILKYNIIFPHILYNVNAVECYDLLLPSKLRFKDLFGSWRGGVALIFFRV